MIVAGRHQVPAKTGSCGVESLCAGDTCVRHLLGVVDEVFECGPRSSRTRQADRSRMEQNGVHQILSFDPGFDAFPGITPPLLVRMGPSSHTPALRWIAAAIVPRILISS